MKARYCHALSALAVGLVASAPTARLCAQAPRAQDPNAPVVIVEVFRSAEKNAGVQVADAIRTRLASDVPVKQLWVRPKQDITANLESSGFPTTEALTMSDARALAQLLRGDMFLVGQVAKDTAGYRVDAQYVLTRDPSLVQPLPTVRVSKPDQAAGPIVKEFREVLKSFASERACYGMARDNKYPEAIAAARKGIVDYPNSTLARICLANVLEKQQAAEKDSSRQRVYSDSILALTNEILRIDARSKPALTSAYSALKATGKTAEATDILLRLVAADPSNARLLEQVVNEFAIGGQAPKAIPFVDQLVRDNQGDPGFLLLQMRVHLAARDLKGGIAAGEELMKADTAASTPELFMRLGAAASVDSQPQKAADLFARGIAKYPTNADLLSTYISILKGSGQSQQALEVIGRAIAANVKVPGLQTLRAGIFSEMNQPDSTLAALQAGIAAGDSAAAAANVAVGLGQRLLKASKTAADFQRTISVLEFANKTSETVGGHLVLGQAQYSLGGLYYNEMATLSRSTAKADRARACESAKAAQAAFAVAQIEVPAGGKAAPQTAGALLAALAQSAPATDQAVKQLCR